MHRLLNRHTLSGCLLIIAFLLFAPAVLWAQIGGGGNGGGGNGGGGNGGGGNGGGGNGGGGNGNNNLPPVAGVEIDPQGVLRIMQQNPQVTRVQLMAAKQALPPQLARPSKLRKVSLNRLEQAVAQRLDQGHLPSPDMVAMAGLNRVEYVFFYPESGDIVLAGPAEGFGRDSVGRIVGVDSGQPCLLLDDVVVALRCFGPNQTKNKTISVSIDPTEAGLARMQQVLQQIGGNYNSAAEVPAIVSSLRQALGHNEVTITGVPAGTHFAHVLTEADYRMKLIGIGLEPVPVPMVNYVGRLTASTIASNALLRWYFVPNYDSISISPDGTALKLSGSGVKLIDEGERVDSSGKRKSVGRTNPASRGYAMEFTKKFNQIASVQPVYAQLRNLIDLSVTASFIQQQDLYQRAGWDLGVFGSEDKLAVETLPPPQQVETAINAMMIGSRLVTPIGGGVTIQARKLLQEGSGVIDQADSMIGSKSAPVLESLSDGQWWWD
jgi:hypothetical protein